MNKSVAVTYLRLGLPPQCTVADKHPICVERWLCPFCKLIHETSQIFTTSSFLWIWICPAFHKQCYYESAITKCQLKERWNAVTLYGQSPKVCVTVGDGNELKLVSFFFIFAKKFSSHFRYVSVETWQEPVVPLTAWLPLCVSVYFHINPSFILSLCLSVCPTLPY